LLHTTVSQSRRKILTSAIAVGAASLAEFVGKGIGLWAQQERPADAHDIYDIDLPDLRMASIVRVLRAWDGELNSLQKLDYAPFKQSMLHQ
jgi:hypothetical protein